MLEANHQLKGGSKPELVDRIIDAKLFGALPKCPKCGGGVLRVNYAVKVGHGGKGKYSCPGYYDGEHPGWWPIQKGWAGRPEKRTGLVVESV